MVIIGEEMGHFSGDMKTMKKDRETLELKNTTSKIKVIEWD